VHFKRNTDTPKRGTKKVRHWPINECTNLKLAKTTPDEIPTSNLTKRILNYIINFEQPIKNDNNKYNPQAKMPLLNRHNQNPNITTAEMLMVLLQWLYSKVWESKFSYLWQQWMLACL